MNKFDGLALSVDTPSRMTILHPGTDQPLKNGTGEPAWIDLLSTDSQVAQAFEDEEANRRLQTQQTAPMSPEERRKTAARKIAALTVGWHLVALDGTAIDIPLTKEDAAELYGHGKFNWLREQVALHLANRANFMPAKSGGSSTSPSTSSA